MNNDELKKKIAQIIADYFCPQRNEHKNLWGDDRLCYSKMNFAECERVAECTDALIAAGIGDVKESENKATAAELVAQVSASTAIEKIAEWKHRAEVAERPLKDVCTNVIKDEEDDLAVEPRARVLYKAYLKQAEKELEEEGKE